MASVNDYIKAMSSLNVDDQATIDMVALMELEVGTEYCTDDLRNKAIALLTMHWLTLPTDGSGNHSQSGSILSEKEGDLSRRYGFSSKTSFSDPFLSLTSYGIALMALNKGCFFKPRTRAFQWLR